MCLIIFKPKNVSFNFEHIETALDFNGDGMGMSIRTKNGLSVYRGVALDDIKENMAFLKGHDVVLHLRYGTSGESTMRQCHPFLVGKKTKKIDFSVKRDESILFHNGIMFSPRGEFSDTQIISRGLKNLESLEQYVPSNRFLIQNFDGDIFLGTWHDVDGMKYSNMSYHIKYEKTLKYSSWEKDIVAESYEGYSVSKYSDEYLMSEICPKCSSDLTEVIDVATMTHECLDCETIFNLDGETYCFEDDFKDDFEEIA